MYHRTFLGFPGSTTHFYYSVQQKLHVRCNAPIWPSKCHSGPSPSFDSRAFSVAPTSERRATSDEEKHNRTYAFRPPLNICSKFPTFFFYFLFFHFFLRFFPLSWNTPQTLLWVMYVNPPSILGHFEPEKCIWK